MSKQPQNQTYSAANIPKLTPQEHVRKRPGMYVGGTDKRALHNMLWYVVEEASAEALQFPDLNEITITFLNDTQIRITDNGMGIPVTVHKSGKPVFEVYMTDHGLRRENYVISKSNDLSAGGLHAIHMFMMNALCIECIAETKVAGFLWQQTYSEGVATSSVEQIRPLADGESTGTSITFTPDFTIMDKGLTFDYDLIVERCRELAYMLPHVTFRVEREDQSVEPVIWHYPAGIRDWIAEVNKEIATLHPVLYKDFSGEYEYKHGKHTIRVELAFQFRTLDAGEIKSFVNTIPVPEGGTHIDGLNESLLTAIYGDAHSDLIDPLNGLIAILHIYHPDPQFQSQTKVELLNPEVKEAVMDCVEVLLAENMDIHAQLQGYFRI